MPMGVVAPLIPRILAAIFKDIKSLAFSGSGPNRNRFTGLRSLAVFSVSPVFSKTFNIPSHTA